VLVLTAANAAYASSMGMLKFGGTLVCVGLPEGELKVSGQWQIMGMGMKPHQRP